MRRLQTFEDALCNRGFSIISKEEHTNKSGLTYFSIHISKQIAMEKANNVKELQNNLKEVIKHTEENYHEMIKDFIASKFSFGMEGCKIFSGNGFIYATDYLLGKFLDSVGSIERRIHVKDTGEVYVEFEIRLGKIYKEEEND